MNITGSLQQKNGIYHTVLNINGKQKWQTTRIKVQGTNRKETSSNLLKAQKILAERIDGAEEAKTEVCTIKLLQYLDDWLERKSRDIRKITAEGYAKYMENHIRPYFKHKNLKLVDVTPMDIQKFVDTKYKQGYTACSIKKYLVVLSGAFDDAVRYNYITYNPCTRVRLPKAHRPATQAYTKDESSELLAAVKGDNIEPAVMLALYLGLRRSEVAGLRWSDIDFAKHVIHIRNTVTKMTTLIEEENTKSKASRRDMKMPEALYDYLVERKKTAVGIHVCSFSDGRPYSPDYISHRFNDFLKKNNLRVIRFHELRHTCGSLLINNGVSAKQVQEYLGHERVSTTMDFYVHLDANKKTETSNRMNEILNFH